MRRRSTHETNTFTMTYEAHAPPLQWTPIRAFDDDRSTALTPWMDRASEYADAVVTWTLTPILECCVRLETLQVETVLSQTLIQCMMQMIIMASHVATVGRNVLRNKRK